MSKPMNWGILGASKFAREHMARAIHKAEGARFAALATSNPEKAAPFQAFAPDLEVHASYDALLADPNIDAVYIPLPNHLHIEYCLKAIDAGKHVLCEKPIAMRASEIDAVIAARDASGLLVSEAYMIVHHPQWQRAKALYEEGAIGDLQHVTGAFCYDNSADAANIRQDPSKGGGGIPDIGVYTYGCTRWLTGQEPDEITHADIDFENGVDVRARVSARFPGFSAYWLNSMRMHNIQEMTFIGTKGVLKLNTPFNANVFGQAEVVLNRGLSSTVERFPGVDHYTLQVENFCNSVQNDVAYPWSLEDAQLTQSMIDAVFEKGGRE